MFQLKAPLSFRSLRLLPPSGHSAAPVARSRPKRGQALPDGVTTEGPSSRKWAFSWSSYDGRGSTRLELAYRQLSPLVSEIPALFEYIDFGGPSDRLQIARIGAYPTGLGNWRHACSDTPKGRRRPLQYPPPSWGFSSCGFHVAARLAKVAANLCPVGEDFRAAWVNQHRRAENARP